MQLRIRSSVQLCCCYRDITYPDGYELDYNYATGVDSNISRLTSISDASGTLEAYSYQGEGAVLQTDRTQPGLTLTKTLDDFGRVMDFNWTNSSGSIVNFEYGYDANSNVLFKEDKVNTGLSELYGYDAINQLATMARGPLNSTKDAITGTPDFEQSWNHDSLGNWDDVTTNGIIDDRDSNAQNEYTDVDGNSPGYDANGNMTTDQDGKHFVWDAWNRLVEVQDSSNATLVTYSYDSLNRRVTSDDGTTVTTLYYSTGWQVLQEQVAGDVTQQFVYSPIYPDALILRDRDTDADGVLDERLWVIQDNNFNVLAITDDTGTVVERYKYTAFGVATVMDASYTVLGSSAYAWVHLHQGLRLEEASGLYDNRFRWYSAELGQFVSNDPIGFDAGDVNIRRYQSSNAVQSTDAFGLTEKDAVSNLANSKDVLTLLRAHLDDGEWEISEFLAAPQLPANNNFFNCIWFKKDLIDSFQMKYPDGKTEQWNISHWKLDAVGYSLTPKIEMDVVYNPGKFKQDGVAWSFTAALNTPLGSVGVGKEYSKAKGDYLETGASMKLSPGYEYIAASFTQYGTDVYLRYDIKGCLSSRTTSEAGESAKKIVIVFKKKVK